MTHIFIIVYRKLLPYNDLGSYNAESQTLLFFTNGE